MDAQLQKQESPETNLKIRLHETRKAVIGQFHRIVLCPVVNSQDDSFLI